MKRLAITVLVAGGLVWPGVAQQAAPVHTAQMTWGKCRGVFSDNTREDGKNGLVELYYSDHPEVNLFAWGGLNMERIFNGINADNDRAGQFGPREEPCTLTVESPQCVKLHWPAENPLWNAESTMTFTATADGYLDFKFEMVFTRDFWSHASFAPPIAGVLFATYLGVNRERAMYFYGMEEERKGWVEHRGDDGFAPNIRAFGLPHFSCEPACVSCPAILAHEKKHFLLPMYYGLIDGDANRNTPDDTIMYLLMFDRSDTIQFGYAAWRNGLQGPALDWEFIVANPRVNTPYEFKARLVIKPFVSREDALAEYEKWRGPQELQALGLK